MTNKHKKNSNTVYETMDVNKRLIGLILGKNNV